MSTQYDSQILQDYADQLYKQAQSVVTSTAAKYGFVMFVASAVGIGVLSTVSQGALTFPVGIVIIGVLTAVAVAAGVGAGRLKAFNLKLEAQRILCQRQIEQNTRTTEKMMAARAAH